MKELTARDRERLKGVHPDLVRVVERAKKLSEVDFFITEGLRTAARQKQLVAAGASWTLNGRHLTGHAVDVAAMLGGKLSWDWPLYYKIADAFAAAAKELDVALVWGGTWKGKQKDGPHFELNRRHYK